MASIENSIYFLLGVFACLYFMRVVLNKNKNNHHLSYTFSRDKNDKVNNIKTNSTKDKINSHEDPVAIVRLYLNVFLLNKKAVVQNVVDSKLRAKIGNRPVLSAIIGRVADKSISENSFGEKVADRLAEQVPVKLFEQGIKAECTVMYTKGAYVCLQVDVLTTDAKKLITKVGGDKKGENFEKIMDFIGIPYFSKSIDDTLAGLIGDKLKEKLPEILKERAQEKVGLEVESVACSEKDQTDFLLYTLKQLKD